MPANTPGGNSLDRAGSMRSGFANLLGMGGNAPGIDYDQINALLQQFGGGRVEDSGPTGPFENTGWGQNHPRFSGGLDNALIALSNMGEPSPTIGGNISNVARGLQSVGPTRQMQRMAPIMMALEQAKQVASLQQSTANIGREGAMAGYYSGRNQTASDIAQSKMNVALQKQQMLAGKEGQILADGTVGLPDIDDNGRVTYVSHPELNPKEFVKQQRKQKIAGIMGNSTEGLIIQGMLGDDPESFKGGPDAYWKQANSIMLDHKKAAAGVSTGGAGDRLTQGEWFANQKDQFNNIYKGPGTAGIREKRIDTRAQEIFLERGGKTPLDKARSDAQWEDQQHRGRLQQAWSEFSLMNPDEQKARGGIMGYLGQQGYDPMQDVFAAPRTGAPAPGRVPSAMPSVAAPSSGPSSNPTWTPKP